MLYVDFLYLAALNNHIKVGANSQAENLEEDQFSGFAQTITSSSIPFDIRIKNNDASTNLCHDDYEYYLVGIYSKLSKKFKECILGQKSRYRS